jgi:hypothetical protein
MRFPYGSDIDSRASFQARRPRATATKDTPLRQLERRHRAALSGAVVAKAYYLAQVGEQFSTPASRERARLRWKRIEARRHELAEQLSNMQYRDRVQVGDLFANFPAAQQ